VKGAPASRRAKIYFQCEGLMAAKLIDLFSDTKTKPTAEMRRFMMAAEVGDE